MQSASPCQLLIACSSLLLPALAAAQPTTKENSEAEKKATVENLPTLVITATRNVEDAAKAPHVVRQLDEETMAERQVRTLPEALRELPGVNVQKTANGQESPFIRGFTGFRNLLLIDGIRFNNSTFREGPNQYWNTIDSYAIDHIELVPGQGSVLYGSDSIGGTLNLFTKGSGFREEEAGWFFHGLSSYRGSTAEESNIGHMEIQFGQGGSWGLHLGASLKSFGDVHAAGIGDQPRTGYDEWAYDARLDIALNPHWTLTAVHQQVRQNDVWRTHQTVFGISWEGTTIGNNLRRSYDQERTLSYLRLEGRDLDGFIDAASITISFQTADEYEHRIRAPAANRIDFTQVEISTLGFDLQFQSDTPIGLWTYGIDYYHDWVGSGSQRYRLDGTFHSQGIQGPVGDASSYDLLGFYLQDQIDAGERLHFYFGGRLNYAKADVGRFTDPATATAVDSFSDHWTNFSASGRIVIDLDAQDRFRLYGGVSQGFRAPNLSDLSRLDIARTGEQEVPAPGLEPENFINFEIGLKADTEHFSGSLNYFHTLIDNMIVRQPTGAGTGTPADPFIVTKQNGGDGFVHGIEIAGEWRIDPNWSLFGHLTWTEGEVDQFPTSAPVSTRQPLSRVVPLMGRAGLRWQSDSRRWWGEFICLAHSRADRLNTGDMRDTQRIPPGGNPGFALLSLRGGCQITENLSLMLGLENLLDEDYRFTGSGSNEPGFGAIFGATVKF